MKFQSVPDSIFFSKNDLNDPRLGDWADHGDFHDEADVFILGYPDDEGIHLNGGRTGAKDGPNQIRSYFYRMTPDARLGKSLLQIRDIGNLSGSAPLSERHQTAQKKVLQLCDNRKLFISLGGGHDYAYADGSGFLTSVLKKSYPHKPLIINFDAHLDVRPSDKGLNSGTAFFRLLEEFKNQFELIEVGIQPQCNSHSHRQYAMSSGAQIYSLENVVEKGLTSLLTDSLDLLTHTPEKIPCFISLDIDCFSSSLAPGCSQSWPLGLDPNSVLASWKALSSKYQIYGLGIYEVSPPLDVADQTSKLAAQMMHQFLFSQYFLDT